MYELIAHYNSGPSSEMIYQVPLNNHRHVAYQVLIDDLQKDDLLVCGCSYEVTNIRNYFMCVAQRLILAQDQGDIDGLTISPANGIDIPACKAYHVNPSCSGTIVIEQDGYHYVTQLIYAGSVWASRGDYCRLEQDYGRLWILHYRIKKDEA